MRIKMNHPSSHSMAQSVPTARIPPTPSRGGGGGGGGGHFPGICLKNKMLQYKSPRWGLGIRTQIPDPWDKIIFLMIEAKKYSHSFQWFFLWFFSIIMFLITTATHFIIGFKTWGFNSFNFCFIKALIEKRQY